MNTIHKQKLRRQKRVRSKLTILDHYRVSVYRSNHYLYAQVIDGKKSHTVASISTKSEGVTPKITRVAQAKEAGVMLAKKMKDLKVKKAVFDRGSYKYAGRVAAFAEGLRTGGITI